jgi:hypothetical protein
VTDWDWITEPRAGPLGPIALAFARRELGQARPPGAAALAALAGAIDRFVRREHATAAEESAFVEGAGAFFGVVLAARLGGSHASRDGVHRVRLGVSGFVDPFAAIEAALETEPARAALVDACDLAEREASGAGPIARAANAFAAVLVERRPDLAITDRFDRRLWIDDVEVDLTRVIGATEDEPERALRAAVTKLVEMLPGGAVAPIDRDEIAARVLPRLLGPRFDAPVATTTLAGDLRVAWVLAYDGRARFVRDRDLERWAITRDTIAELALRNLAARSERARFARVELDEGACIVARTGDGLDSARMLLPALAETLTPEIGTPCIVAVPHRDALYACADVDAMHALLLRRVADDHARAPHAISAALYRLRADRSIELVR